MLRPLCVTADACRDTPDELLDRMHAVVFVAHAAAVKLWELSQCLGPENGVALHADYAAREWAQELDAILIEQARRHNRGGHAPAA